MVRPKALVAVLAPMKRWSLGFNDTSVIQLKGHFMKNVCKMLEKAEICDVCAEEAE